MEKVYGYVRVSTVEQGDGTSPEEQKSDIQAFANKNNLHIVEWFEEYQTAAKQGRKAFGEMVLALGKNDDVSGAIIHQIDRFTRNFGDWHTLNLLADSGKKFYSARGGFNIFEDSRRTMSNIEVVLGEAFIRNLRKETKKGIDGRLKQGYYPLPAPVGYLDMGGGEVKQVDPAAAPLIKEMFNLYATERYSIKELAKVMRKKGLKNKKGGYLTKTGVNKILKNPFYIGIMYMQRSGRSFAGLHEPIISKALFDRVQEIMDGKSVRKVFKHDFPFRRKLKCAHCGYSLNGERQKGHIYYRCQTKGCPTATVRQRSVNFALSEYVQSLTLNENQIAEIYKYVGSLHIAQRQENLELRKATQVNLANIDKRIDRLTDLLLDGSIDNQIYQQKKRKLLEQQVVLKEKLTNMDNELRGIKQQIASILELLKSYSFSQKEPSPHEIAQFASVTTSNLQVRGKRLIIKPISPYDQLLQARKMVTGTPVQDEPPKNDAPISQKLGKDCLVEYDLTMPYREQSQKLRKFDCEQLARTLVAAFM